MYCSALRQEPPTQCNSQQLQRTMSLVVEFRKGKPSDAGEGVVPAQLFGNLLVGRVLLGTSAVRVGCRWSYNRLGRTTVRGGRVGQIQVEVIGREGPTGRSCGRCWCWLRSSWGSLQRRLRSGGGGSAILLVLLLLCERRCLLLLSVLLSLIRHLLRLLCRHLLRLLCRHLLLRISGTGAGLLGKRRRRLRHDASKLGNAPCTKSPSTIRCQEGRTATKIRQMQPRKDGGRWNERHAETAQARQGEAAQNPRQLLCARISGPRVSPSDDQCRLVEEQRAPVTAVHFE